MPLSAFTAMGGTQSFAYTAAANQTYRFIVSLAQAQQTPGTQSITLTYTPTGATGQLQGAAALTRTAAVLFGLAAAGGTLIVTAPSAAEETSRWYGCGQLLVLEAPATLPADAQLTVTAGGKTTVHTRNARGQFVVPLAWAQQKSLSLALATQQAAAAGRDYALSAALYTAAGGQRLLATGCTADLSLAVPQLTAPALKISGGQRLLTVGQPISVTLAMQNTDGGTVSATVQVRGAGGGYSGNFLTAENLAAGEQSFSLAAITQPGSYRLLVTVTKGGRQVLAVPYYFIVQ